VDKIMNSGFHKIMRNSRVAAQLAASQEGLSSTKLVTLLFVPSCSLLSHCLPPTSVTPLPDVHPLALIL
jgi:hypothetical protein